MDDRSSFWIQDPENSLSLTQKWISWSQKLGLMESPNKIQFVAKSEQHKTFIRDRPPEWLKGEATILGVTIVTRRRSLSPKENERLDGAWSKSGHPFGCPFTLDTQDKNFSVPSHQKVPIRLVWCKSSGWSVFYRSFSFKSSMREKVLPGNRVGCSTVPLRTCQWPSVSLCIKRLSFGMPDNSFHL